MLDISQNVRLCRSSAPHEEYTERRVRPGNYETKYVSVSISRFNQANTDVGKHGTTGTSLVAQGCRMQEFAFCNMLQLLSVIYISSMTFKYKIQSSDDVFLS